MSLHNQNLQIIVFIVLNKKNNQP